MMTEEIEISNVAKETIILLNYFDSNFISKISTNFLMLLKELAQKSTITVTIDKTKKLKDQNVSEECKNLIALIYHSYIADEKEKSEMEKIWNTNELLYHNKLREKYDMDNIFKKGHKDNVQLVEYKKPSFLSQLLKRIKSYFERI